MHLDMPHSIQPHQKGIMDKGNVLGYALINHLNYLS